jgi:hypothetical protein
VRSDRTPGSAGMNYRIVTDSGIAIAAIFYGGLLTISAWAGFFGAWLGWLLLLSLWRHGYGVVRVVAQGKRAIPAPGLETLNPAGDWRIFAHGIAFFAALALTTGLRGNAATSAAAAAVGFAGIAVVGLFPASIALMALSGRLEAAFNPVAIARIVRVLGAHYAVLAAGCIALYLLTRALPDFRLTPGGLLVQLLGNLFEVWALLAAFALTGAALRGHRLDLPIPGDRETPEERAARERREDWRRVLDLAYASMRSGLFGEAFAELRRLAAEHGDSPEVLYFLFENMLEWEDRAPALQIGRRLIDQHVADGDTYAALELLTRIRRMSPEFRVPAESARRLADFARSIGREGTADELAAAGGPAGPAEL